MNPIPFEAWAESEMIKEIEQLRAEVERLKEILQKPKIDEFSYNKIQKENKQLREALRQCSPWEAYIPENTNIWMPCCKFCRHISVPDITLEESMKYHKDDCEYIRLTEVK